MIEEHEKIVWHNERRKVSELRDHPKNPRLATAKGMKELEESIESIGYASVMLVSVEGVILGGHRRKDIFRKLGQLGEIDVRVPNRTLTEEEEKEVMLRDNKNIAGEWDFDILANDFEMPMLMDIGFTDVELQIGSVISEKSKSDAATVLSEHVVEIECDSELHRMNVMTELIAKGLRCRRK